MKPFSIWVKQGKPRLLNTEGSQSPLPPPLRPARHLEEGERGARAAEATLKEKRRRETNRGNEPSLVHKVDIDREIN
jgi:hypothetical protein